MADLRDFDRTCICSTCQAQRAKQSEIAELDRLRAENAALRSVNAAADELVAQQKAELDRLRAVRAAAAEVDRTWDGTDSPEHIEAKHDLRSALKEADRG